MGTDQLVIARPQEKTSEKIKIFPTNVTNQNVF